MTFKGFSKPNTIPVPIEFFDEGLHLITRLATLKVILKVIQRTLGYGKTLDWIALDQFETGIVTTKRGRQPERTQIDQGVGLSRSAIRDGLEDGVALGYLLKRVVCPSCGQAVGQQMLERHRTHRGQAQTYQELSVLNICPHCQGLLKGRERISYGLHWLTELENGVANSYPISGNRVGNSYPISTNADHNAGNGVANSYPHKITNVSKLADASWADAPQTEPADQIHATEPDSEHAVDRLTLGSTCNQRNATSDVLTSAADSTRHSAAEMFDRVRFMLENGLHAALATLFDEIGLRFGLTPAGLRAVGLSLTPLPERRRRVLDDMRRMQGRTDFSERERKRKVRAIVTQNVAVTIGLGLKPNGSLRVVAEKEDYNIVGGLINDFGAEVVWDTTCSIAGQAIEGDPIDYLRAALQHRRDKQNRSTNKNQVNDFTQLDYASSQVLPDQEVTR